MDLAEYADVHAGRAKLPIAEWMQKHPDIANQVLAGRDNPMRVTWDTIAEWLKTEHDADYGPTTVRKWWVDHAGS